MGNPVFLLQIVHAKGGNIATLPGGGRLEADLVELITSNIMDRGVGLFKTSNHVEQDIREGISDAIMSLKVETRHLF